MSIRDVETNTSDGLDMRPKLSDSLNALNSDIDSLDELIRVTLRDKLKFVSLPDVQVPADDMSAPQDIPPMSEAIQMVMHMQANVARMQAELRHIIEQARI